MKNILRIGVTAIAIMFLFNIAAIVETKAQGGPVGEVLKRMDTHYKALKSLRANVAREKYNSQLDETDKYSGAVSLIPGEGRNFSFRLDWTKPSKEAISVVNGKYVAYKESTKTVYTGNSDSKTVNDKGGSVLKIFSMKKDEIRSAYDVYYVGQENISGDIPTWHLKLVPKTKTNFKFYEIWVDGNGMPLMGKMTASNDDTDTILISKLEKNVKLNAAIFKINYPKGTTVVVG
jgi:outer membrane lipoprotein-sorting protein